VSVAEASTIIEREAPRGVDALLSPSRSAHHLEVKMSTPTVRPSLNASAGS